MPPSPLLTKTESALIVIDVDRPTLHRRIEERFDRMVGEGALEEVRGLVTLGLDPNLPAMKAIGVREFSAVLNGDISLAAAIAKAKTQTRRYGKRQDTWFRHQMPDWTRLRA